MNKARRKELNNLLDKIEDLKGELLRIELKEDEAYCNTPENLKNDDSELCVSLLNDAIDDIDNAIQNIIEAVGG